jgi:hypothetical protein
MKIHIIGFTLGSVIPLAPTLVLAQTASFSGTVTYQSPSNAVTTITGEMTLPKNLYFSSNGTVTYNATGTPNTDSFSLTSLTLQPGSVATVDPSASLSVQASNSFNQAIANNDLAEAISILRAAGGVDGLE